MKAFFEIIGQRPDEIKSDLKRKRDLIHSNGEPFQIDVSETFDGAEGTFEFLNTDLDYSEESFLIKAENTIRSILKNYSFSWKDKYRLKMRTYG